MTIAAAFYCQDGLILSADTEVGTDIEKWHEAKIISCVESDEIRFAITGAGSWDYVKMASNKLFPRLLNAEADLGVPFGVVEGTILEIYSGSVSADREYVKARFDLLIAICTPDFPVPTIIRTSGSVVRSGHRFECVGTGQVIGRHLFSKLYQPNLTLEQGAVLAAYIVGEAKEKASGVSGGTLIPALHSNGSSEVSGAKLADLNKWFLKAEKLSLDLQKIPNGLFPIFDCVTRIIRPPFS